MFLKHNIYAKNNNTCTIRNIIYTYNLAQQNHLSPQQAGTYSSSEETEHL